MFDSELYLNRIHLAGPLSPRVETLQLLHQAHLTAIPYENIDILAGLPFDLDESALFEKIVLRHRGGYCYELNLLFAKLLREIGFEVDLLSARIVQEDGSLGPEFDHAVLLVTLQERWLADVGNTRWFHSPLCIEDPNPQNQEGWVYRVEQAGDQYIMFQRNAEEEERPQYRFTLQPYQAVDFGAMCHHKWTSPESRFTQGYICSRVVAGTRLVLTHNRFVTVTGGRKTARCVENETDFAALLGEYFGTEYRALLDRPRKEGRE